MDRGLERATGPELEVERKLLRSLTRFLHVNDPERAEAYSTLLEPAAPRYSQLGSRMQCFARMLFYTFWNDAGGYVSYDQGLDFVRRHGYLVRELQELMAHNVANSPMAPKALGIGMQHIPLYSHANYWRSEVLAALNFGAIDQGKAVEHREGVAWCPGSSTDVFFVTLNKDEAVHNPTTLYKDYALSPTLFHWESQNSTAPETPTGRRYLGLSESDSNVVLLTRDEAKDGEGKVQSFTCLGLVDYVDHRGSKPIAITWRLKREMPVDVFSVANAVAR